MWKKQPTILYFTKASAVTEEDQAEIEKIRGNVKVRNGSAAVPENLEECSAVAGHAPERYRKAYPVYTPGGTAEAADAGEQPKRRGRAAAKKGVAKSAPGARPPWTNNP